jgi:hypothetical protein
MTVIDRTLSPPLVRAGVLVAMFALAACGDEASDDGMLPAAGSGTPLGSAGMGTAGMGTAGMGMIGSGTAGSSAAGSSAAGSSAAGAGGAGSSAAGAGAAGSSGSSAAGSGGAGSGAAGAAAHPPATSLALPTTKESPNVEPWFNVYRPTDLAAVGRPVPVIVWANGGCFRSDFTWEPLFQRWAKGGFVVLALTEGPDGPLVQSSVEDQGGLIDWALDRAEYKGMLDSERIVAAGNSCGGITALGLAAEDERVSAVFVLSGSSSIGSADLSVINAIEVPVGYVVGGPEDIAGANATSDYDALGAGIPAMIVSRSSGDHMTVSTDTMILPQVAEIALNWMDLALYGTQAAADALKSPTICTGCQAGVWSLKSKGLDTLVK